MYGCSNVKPVWHAYMAYIPWRHPLPGTGKEVSSILGENLWSRIWGRTTGHRNWKTWWLYSRASFLWAPMLQSAPSILSMSQLTYWADSVGFKCLWVRLQFEKLHQHNIKWHKIWCVMQLAALTYFSNIAQTQTPIMLTQCISKLQNLLNTSYHQLEYWYCTDI